MAARHGGLGADDMGAYRLLDMHEPCLHCGHAQFEHDPDDGFCLRCRCDGFDYPDEEDE